MGITPHGCILKALLGGAIFLGSCLLGVPETAGQTTQDPAAPDYSPASFWREDLEEMHDLAKATIGIASWYGKKFRGRRTASGERYDPNAFTCASRHLPFGTILEVTNLTNGKKALVRVNDRGPFNRRRILDVSYAVAKDLEFLRGGVTKIAYQILQ